MATLSAEAQKNVKATLDKITSDKQSGVSGLVFAAVNKSGQFLTHQASGTRGVDTATPMTEESVFYIASCTKMITGLACMQLVEQGKLDLDSHEKLYKLCPELKEKQVLVAKDKLVPRQGEITLRLLLTHTAGFGYTFFNERLRDYARPAGFEEFAGDEDDYLLQPLVNQPGSRWEYGVRVSLSL